MITIEPVGDWNWEAEVSGDAARPSHAVTLAGAIWDILAARELALPPGRLSFSVRSFSDMRDVHVSLEDRPVESGRLPSDVAVADAAGRADRLKGDFLVSLRIMCPGVWWESGVRYRAEQLFAFQVDIWKSSLAVVTLETYSDAWLTMDTREREQLAVHAVNEPRLRAVLDDITSLMGVPPEPGDSNRHATPTGRGFADPRVEGFAYSDSWGTYDVPARARRLRQLLPPSEGEYEEITDHPVCYFTVRRGDQVLGYVWASVGEDAAGFEPRTAAGNAAFDAGAEWVLRLREAYEEGLSAIDALGWLARVPVRPEMGCIVEDTPQQAESLDALEDLSGRY
ncbi:hypothetical protein [Streptomyces sp. SudanB91_2054]|uniref:hypothetical protein n=1 Tax=Streptomyces sp. SudanB91_2054 TaxID=3035278 RepID=UPI0036DB0CC4